MPSNGVDTPSQSPIVQSPIVPDTKDWTWVLDRPCPDCGFDGAALDVEDLPALLEETTTAWSAVLEHARVRERPSPGVWSPLEYGAHVRDVHRVFEDRLRLMLSQDRPRFASWDQDETALAERYDEQDPSEVRTALVEAAQAVSATYASIAGESRHRRGSRSDGSEFTVETLGRYHLHDVVHHLWDVRG